MKGWFSRAAGRRHFLRATVCWWVALMAVTAAQAAAGDYYFTTLAGSASAGSTDGPVNQARFNEPSALAVDVVGNIYVADTMNHTVRRITPGGVVSTLAGQTAEPEVKDGQGTAARFYLPLALAVGAEGGLYVGDQYTVRRVSASGAVTTLAGAGNEGGLADGVGAAARFFGGVQALQPEPDGNLLVLDQRTLRRMKPDGTVKTLYTKDDFWTNGLFCGMARDAAGNIHVACVGIIPQEGGATTSQARIYRLSPGGSITLTVDETNGWSGVKSVRGLAVDPAGNLFVADNGLSTIRKLAAAGGGSLYAGVPGLSGAKDGAVLEARFTGPLGLAFDAGGNLLVAEKNNTIRRITPGGTVSTLAGASAEESGRHADGQGRAARFFHPKGVAVTAAGICYVADTNNHVIRRITANGTVTTLAGAAGQPGYVDGTGTEARFNFPKDLALDASGNIYAIEDNSTVRKITPSGVVTTFAGNGLKPNQSIEGRDAPNERSATSSLAVAPNGEVYVVERGLTFYPQQYYFVYFNRILKVAASGVMTTEWMTNDSHAAVTGLAIAPDGALYFCDHVYESAYRMAPGGKAERIFLSGFAPWRVAASPSGGVFLTEGYYGASARVAQLFPDGRLEIIGGRDQQPGDLDGIGPAALFDGVQGIAADEAGALYVACDNNTIRKGVIAAAPRITTQPLGQAVAAGISVQFAVTATAAPAPTYQWYCNGNRIAGATAASYGFTSASAMDAGEYTVVVTNELGSVTSEKAVLSISGGSTPPPPSGGTGQGSTGGGGAPSVWFLGALLILCGGRLGRRQ